MHDRVRSVSLFLSLLPVLCLLSFSLPFFYLNTLFFLAFSGSCPCLPQFTGCPSNEQTKAPGEKEVAFKPIWGESCGCAFSHASIVAPKDYQRKRLAGCYLSVWRWPPLYSHRHTWILPYTYSQAKSHTQACGSPTHHYYSLVSQQQKSSKGRSC